MVDKDLTQRVENQKKILGADALINEFLGWMTKDDVKLFVENVDSNWDIDSTKEVD